MANQKTSQELIKALLEDAGLSTADVLSLLVPGLTECGAYCSGGCSNCKVGCYNGPTALRQRNTISSELIRLKDEILFELKR